MRVLFITYEFPPKGGPGVQRPAKTARYLAEDGWDVTVLTVADEPTSLLDPRLAQEIPASVRVLRAWSAEPTRLVQWLRRRGGRDSGAAETGPDRGAGSEVEPVRGAQYSGLPLWAIRLVRAFLLPDEKVGWSRYAVRAAAAAHSEAPFDVILASGPPFTAMRVAMRLSQLLGLPWVADLRDPIVGGYFFVPPTPRHAWWFRRFERCVVSSASRVVVVTEGMRADLLGRLASDESHIVTVTNGFDPADFARVEEASPDPSEGFVVTYAGIFQGTIQPTTFLEAIAQLRAEDALTARDLRVRFVGRAGSVAEATVERLGLGDIVEMTGYVPHIEAVRAMRTADVLLLVLGSEPAQRAILTGKLPEYLGAGRPVLALVPDGVAADTLRRAGHAEIVNPENVSGVAEALSRLHSLWRADALPAPDPKVVAEFDRRDLVRAVGAILEHAVTDSREPRS